MHELLKKFWKDNEKAYLLQPMNAYFTSWANYRNAYKRKNGEITNIQDVYQEWDKTGIKGFIFENHIGIDNVKELAGKGLYVYGMRHGDDWCEPSTLENREVVVNFFAYFVTDQSPDHFFTEKKDWKRIYSWNYDWDDEYYWE